MGFYLSEVHSSGSLGGLITGVGCMRGSVHRGAIACGLG